MSENKSKNIVIIALCITLIFMGVGFSLLSQQLTINGSASVTGSWNVHISSISAVSGRYGGVNADATTLGYYNQTSGSLNAANNILGVKTYTDSEATFNVLLNEPGDYVIYDVTVANTGSIDAVLTGANLIVDTSTDAAADPSLNIASGEEQDIFSYVVVDSTYADTDTASLVSGATTLANTTGTEHIFVKVMYNSTALTGVPSSDADTNADTTNFTGSRGFNASRAKLTLTYGQS